MRAPITKKQADRVRDELIPDLVRLKHKCGELGLLATMQAIDLATYRAGYELIELAPWPIDEKTRRDARRALDKRRCDP